MGSLISVSKVADFETDIKLPNALPKRLLTVGLTGRTVAFCAMPPKTANKRGKPPGGIGNWTIIEDFACLLAVASANEGENLGGGK